MPLPPLVPQRGAEPSSGQAWFWCVCVGGFGGSLMVNLGGRLITATEHIIADELRS